MHPDREQATLKTVMLLEELSELDGVNVGLGVIDGLKAWLDTAPVTEVLKQGIINKWIRELQK